MVSPPAIFIFYCKHSKRSYTICFANVKESLVSHCGCKESIPDSETEQKYRGGKDEVERLELPAPLEPARIACIRKSEADEQSRSCRIEDV
jgi:hypothetical protein